MGEFLNRETFNINGDQLLQRVRELIREGNVRRIRIKHEGQTVVELPLTLGVVGAVLMPMLAAVGALAALVGNCTIEVERQTPPTDAKDSGIKVEQAGPSA